MTVSGNGTVKRIIAGVVTAIIVFLFVAVLADQSRITAVEVEMRGIKDQLNTNRSENRDDHKVINDKLDVIAREIRK
jgi:uncharacterized membrane protein (DUF106 family)